MSVPVAVCERYFCRIKPVSLRFRGGEGGGIDGLVTFLVCERSCCSLWAFLLQFVSVPVAVCERYFCRTKPVSLRFRGGEGGGWVIVHYSCLWAFLLLFLSVLVAVCEWYFFRTKPVSLRFRGGEGGGVDGLVTPPQSYDQLSIEERRWIRILLLIDQKFLFCPLDICYLTRKSCGFHLNKSKFVPITILVMLYILVGFNQCADPRSVAFLTPGSGIRNRVFPDPGSQTHTFESLPTLFWVKSSIILWKLWPKFFSSAFQK